MTNQQITEARLAFDAKLASWAKSNGYKMRGHLWRKPDHYLTSRREGDVFIAERRAYGSGSHIADLSI